MKISDVFRITEIQDKNGVSWDVVRFKTWDDAEHDPKTRKLMGQLFQSTTRPKDAHEFAFAILPDGRGCIVHAASDFSHEPKFVRGLATTWFVDPDAKTGSDDGFYSTAEGTVED